MFDGRVKTLLDSNEMLSCNLDLKTLQGCVATELFFYSVLFLNISNAQRSESFHVRLPCGL